jgi:chemotaxis signal transduction protein
VDGVISARGQVIPVVNLRARFGFPRVEPTVRTRLLVVASGGRTVGLVVDSAREFVAIETDGLLPPPEGLSATSGRYLSGMTRAGDRLLLVLDVRELLELQGSTPAASAG